MNKKGKNEELQSRREFFKKAAKGALPILGAIVLANAPVIAKASEETVGCKYCSYYCSGGCQGTCKGSCRGGCDGGCDGYCKYSCPGSCKGSCSGSCQSGCTSSNF